MRLVNDRQQHARTYCICFIDISLYHFSKNGLAPDVPDLQCDLHVPWQLDSFDKEIHSDGLLILAAEEIVAEPHNERGLSDCAVSEHHYFVLEILGLIIVLVLVVVLSELWRRRLLLFGLLVS